MYEQKQRRECLTDETQEETSLETTLEPDRAGEEPAGSCRPRNASEFVLMCRNTFDGLCHTLDT